MVFVDSAAMFAQKIGKNATFTGVSTDGIRYIQEIPPTKQTRRGLVQYRYIYFNQ
jgi:hypothetical protein